MEVQDKTLLGKRFKPAALAQDGDSIVIHEGRSASSYQLSAVARLGHEGDLLTIAFASGTTLVVRLPDAAMASRWENLLSQWVSYLRQVPVSSLVGQGAAGAGESLGSDMGSPRPGGGSSTISSRREAAETVLQSAGSKCFGGVWDDDLHLRLRGRLLQYHRGPGPEDEVLGYVHCASIAGAGAGGLREDGRRYIVRVALRGGQAPWELGFETRALADEWRRALQPQGPGGAFMTVGRTVGKIFAKEKKSASRSEDAVGVPFNVVRQTRTHEEQLALEQSLREAAAEEEEKEEEGAEAPPPDASDAGSASECPPPPPEGPGPGLLESEQAMFEGLDDSMAAQLQRALSVYDSSALTEPVADSDPSEFATEEMLTLGETLQSYLEEGDPAKLRRLTLLPAQADPRALQRAAVAATQGLGLGRAAALLRLRQGLEEAAADSQAEEAARGPSRSPGLAIGGNRRGNSPPPARRADASPRQPQPWVSVALKHERSPAVAPAAAVPVPAAVPPPVPPKPKVLPKKGRSPPAVRRKPQPMQHAAEEDREPVEDSDATDDPDLVY